MRLLTLTLLALFLFGLGACGDGPAERAGESIDDTIEDAGDAVEDAGDAVEDATDGG